VGRGSEELRCGGLGVGGRVGQVLLFELEDSDALLAVGFGFGGAVGVDAAFGEEVGASAGDDQCGPAVAGKC
jgi:hypothetical protein